MNKRTNEKEGNLPFFFDQDELEIFIPLFVELVPVKRQRFPEEGPILIGRDRIALAVEVVHNFL